MPKVRLSEAELISLYKERILALLRGQFQDGIGEREVMELYKEAKLEIIRKAIDELIAEKKVEKVS